MTKAYLITRCTLDNPVKHYQTDHNNSSSLHTIKSANQNILLRLDSFEKPYKQLELLFHRDTSKHSKTMDKTLALRARVFTIVFSCLDSPVKHSLSLFIYYMKIALQIVTLQLHYLYGSKFTITTWKSIVSLACQKSVS